MNFRDCFKPDNITATFTAFAMVMTIVLLTWGIIVSIKHEFFKDTPCTASSSTPLPRSR